MGSNALWICMNECSNAPKATNKQTNATNKQIQQRNTCKKSKQTPTISTCRSIPTSPHVLVEINIDIYQYPQGQKILFPQISRSWSLQFWQSICKQDADMISNHFSSKIMRIYIQVLGACEKVIMKARLLMIGLFQYQLK